jgi:VacB/RNase II family 3'-5' exoribonuclease
MLDLGALAQLKNLKESISEAKVKLTGTVRGTAQRFGFVNVNEGENAGSSYFLPADQMEQLFPGDEIEFCLCTDKDDKEYAEIEKLIHSPLAQADSNFVGSYVVKGKAHCVAPDVNGLTRWIFIPPQKRKNAKADDFIQCKIIKHPYHNEGKAQAEILQVMGSPDAPRSEHDYIRNKHQLLSEFSTDEQAQADAITEALLSEQTNRTDLTELAFCTIDGASTLDMDDAFYVEKSNDANNKDGWTVHIAIADPSSLIGIDSALDKTSQQRISSVYFPGETLSMLPRNLTNDLFSLKQDCKRLALVLKIELDDKGASQSVEFIDAVINSQAKLSYEQASKHLDDNNFDGLSEELASSLKLANKASFQRMYWRQEHCVMQQERSDYRVKVDENLKAENVVRLEKTSANAIIEEFMLLANVSAAQFIKENRKNDLQGVFQTNAGIRADKHEEMDILCRQHWNIACPDFSQPLATKKLYDALDRNETAKRVLGKSFSRTISSTDAVPHEILGFEVYSTVTSPIRRFQDLHLHRVIRALRDGTDVPLLTDAQLEQMNSQSRAIRFASNELDQWQTRQFLQAKLADKTGKKELMKLKGEVQHITGAGIAITLLDYGINGFLLTKNEKPEFKLNGLTHTLTNKELTFELGQIVEVKINKVDMERKNILLGWA